MRLCYPAGSLSLSREYMHIYVFHVKPNPNLILQQECVRDKVAINFRVCDGVQANAVLSKQLHKAKSVK